MRRRLSISSAGASTLAVLALFALAYVAEAQYIGQYDDGRAGRFRDKRARSVRTRCACSPSSVPRDLSRATRLLPTSSHVTSLPQPRRS